MDIHLYLSILEQGCDVVLVFVDLSKAFVRIPHIPLLQHLKDIGLDHHIIQWIVSHLLNREQYIVGEVFSDTNSVVSSVPQGSLPGPLLFITCVNFVNSLMLTKGTQITIYVNYILLIMPIRVTNDHICLQRDITAIEESIDDLHLSISQFIEMQIHSRNKKSSLISFQ